MHFFHGLTYFDEILQEADGVILSRGNLGIDLPPEKCNMAGKPAVVTLVVDSMTENLRPPRAEANDVANAILDGSNAILLGAETLRGLYPTVVAALASDPNVWNAVWENKALQELLQSQNANKEYVADNESIGDTDSQDAAVSSKKLTELSDDENETGNSQTGLMDVINNVKLTVVDMVTNVCKFQEQNDESIDLTFKGVPHQFNKVFVELVQGGHGHLVMMKKKLITKMIIVTMMDVMKQIWREICYCENEGQVIELLYSLGKSEGFGYHMLEKHIVQDW
ncbi:pyruvate kinase-like isoform X5 [Populus alba x Populus x berolinensis]|nr:pyruvate kinase-like isoform X5 [Populus alba x Populus x berolinensis]